MAAFLHLLACLSFFRRIVVMQIQNLLFKKSTIYTYDCDLLDSPRLKLVLLLVISMPSISSIMEDQDWDFEDDLDDILRFLNDDCGNDFTPSPSSIPSLTFSSTPSRPSLTESESNDDPWTANTPEFAAPRAPQSSTKGNEVEHGLEYVYESRASTFNDSHSCRARNRASGGFFRRLLRRDPRTSDEQTCIAETHFGSDRIIGRGATYSAVTSERMLRCRDSEDEKNIDSWPLPPSSTSHPILGSCSLPLANETPMLPAAILDSCNFALDLDSEFLAYAPEPSNNSPSGSAHTSGPKLTKAKYSTPASSNQELPFTTALSSPTLPHTPSTSPFFPTPESGDIAKQRRSSITHTLRLFPTPPTRIAPKARLGKELPSLPLEDFVQSRKALYSSDALAAVPTDPRRLGTESRALTDEEEKERLLREHELATHSLRYEDTSRCWEPFRTLWAADLSHGRFGKSRTPRERRSLGCW